ncbi:hypothetical protein NKR23_g10011 [Pleurostoma richardsiae]|uniref:Uncharacterized protein n=1 Tax=Pleurostoma richardsiae TaxID=41990 RepID=A0AA38RLE3_9PEZI|nr:hypothetical protein NKR23_g10011 [Pleurostoma richardsiae]
MGERACECVCVPIWFWHGRANIQGISGPPTPSISISESIGFLHPRCLTALPIGGSINDHRLTARTWDGF